MKKVLLCFFVAISLFGIQASAQPSKPALPETPFSIGDSAAYTGNYKYENLPFEFMNISVRDNQLYFSGGQYQGFLTPMKNQKDVFDANGAAIFTFLRNNDFKVSELKIDYEGQTYLGKKEEK